MAFYESLKQAMASLKSNKLRTVLTMLGIIMGVFSIIAIVAIGDAAKAYMSSEVDKLGANVVTIQAGSGNMMMGGDSAGSDVHLTLDDMDIVRKSSNDIINIAATVNFFGRSKVGTEKPSLLSTGITSQFKSITTIDMLEGRFITDIDVSLHNPVIVIDHYAAEHYFKNISPIGKMIEISADRKTYYQVKIVGVYDAGSSMAMGMMGGSTPIFAYLPISTALDFQGKDTISNIKVATVSDENKLKELGDKVVSALNFSKGTEDAFSATTSADTASTFTSILNIISAVLLVIAIITLIVGGIGIINILLVSVTERIREIGIRKALGAQKKDIIMQFITESIIMTGIGGLIGIAMGIGAGNLISIAISIPPTVNFAVVIFAFLGSVILGMVFGVYPAKKAADLDPIEALRSE